MVDMITNTDPSKIRHVMLKPMLLKQIKKIYQVILKDEKFSEKLMYVHVYDFYMNKFGDLKVSESKFNQFCCSCVKHKDNLRIHTFGRFMCFYDSLNIDAMTEFLKFMNSIEKLSSIGVDLPGNDYDEQVYIPAERAIEVARLRFQESLKATEYSEFISSIKQLAVPDKVRNNKGGIIDIDQFLMTMLD